jgi:hypothetical protein
MSSSEFSSPDGRIEKKSWTSRSAFGTATSGDGHASRKIASPSTTSSPTARVAEPCASMSTTHVRKPCGERRRDRSGMSGRSAAANGHVIVSGARPRT